MKKLLLVFFVSVLFLGCRQDVGFTELPSVDNGDLGGGVQQPPVVRVVQPPSDQIQGEDNSVVYEVIPGDNPVDSIECYVDGVLVECDLDGGTIVIENPGLGDHEVRIIAKDDEGLEGEDRESWTVHNRFLRQTEDVAVNSEERQSDILFVIDNSGSMAQEQRGIADKIKNFINRLDGLSWRIAITTTDPDGTRDYEDGRLVPYPNRSHFLTPQLTVDQAKDQFAEAITREENGSGNERGIHAVYRAIERYQNPTESDDNNHVEFFREKAALSVVVISDETETLRSISTNDLLPDQFKSNGDNLISYVRSVWGNDKLFQFNSIITRPGDDLCLESAGKGGTGLSYGVAYDELSRKTNGVVGDICSSDYSAPLRLIGKEVAGLQTTYQIACVPQDIDRDGIIDLEVNARNGGSVPGFKVQGDKVIFDEPLDIGNYQFHFFCLNSVSN